MMHHYTREQYQAALDDLERRGVVEISTNERGEKQYHFPDAETGKRLLNENRQAWLDRQITGARRDG